MNGKFHKFSNQKYQKEFPTVGKYKKFSHKFQNIAVVHARKI